MSRRLASVLVFVCLLPLGASASGQSPPDAADPWEIAREHYRNEDFDRAIPFIAEAIQREPLNPLYYLGLARAEYWRGNHDAAVYYYDIYLVELVDRLPAELPRQNRVDRVHEERDSANSEREDPAAPVVPPVAQERARELFVERLDVGPILTDTGGGALSLFEGMLRSGYARPDIVGLRTQLADALLREADALLDDRRARMPSLALTAWDTQRQRYAEWLEFGGHPIVAPAPVEAPTDAAPAPAGPEATTETVPTDVTAGEPVTAPLPVTIVDRVRARLATCEAQIQYLNLNHARAHDSFAQALSLDPDSLPAQMGRLNAMVQLGRGRTPEATEALQELAEGLVANRPTETQTVDIYRAAFAASAGEHARAAELLAGVLGIPNGEATESR